MAELKLRIESEELSEESKKVAEAELRETPELVEESLRKLKELLANDSTLYFKNDDFLLQVFLRPTKFYPQSAYELMKRVADFKQKNESTIGNLLPRHEEQAFINTKVVNVLVNRDQDGRRVLVLCIGSPWDPKELTTDQIFRILYLIHLAAIREPETQVKGGIIILDFNGLSYKQALSFSPSFSCKLLTFIQDAMPLRVKEVHIVKQPLYFNLVWNLFKPFIREKLRKRMFFHGNKMASLHKYIHPDNLPEDYGGNKPKINYSSAQWYPVLSEIEDSIAEWNTFGNVKKSS